MIPVAKLFIGAAIANSMGEPVEVPDTSNHSCYDCCYKAEPYQVPDDYIDIPFWVEFGQPLVESAARDRITSAEKWRIRRPDT